MIKYLPLLGILITLSLNGYSQDAEQPGKPITEIFTDFHLNLNDTSKTSGFGINRAYLGYQYTPGGNITGKIILNIGTPEDLATGSTPRRYSFFREASINWSDGKLSITGGITGTKMFQFQQSFWGKRYIANTYQSLNGYGLVADLGFVAEYKFSDLISADYTLMNGEGYSNIQLDNSLKNSLGLTITPGKFSFRIYSDIIRVKGMWQTLLVAFAGYKNDFFTLGSEISYKSNTDLTLNHDLWGISSTGAVSISKKTELFMRFDYATSSTLKGDVLPWNYQSNGNLLISGIQVTFNKFFKLALDYQGQSPYELGRSKTKMIYVNGLFKF